MRVPRGVGRPRAEVVGAVGDTLRVPARADGRPVAAASGGALDDQRRDPRARAVVGARDERDGSGERRARVGQRDARRRVVDGPGGAVRRGVGVRGTVGRPDVEGVSSVGEPAVGGRARASRERASVQRALEGAAGLVRREGEGRRLARGECGGAGRDGRVRRVGVRAVVDRRPVEADAHRRAPVGVLGTGAPVREGHAKLVDARVAGRERAQRDGGQRADLVVIHRDR